MHPKAIIGLVRSRKAYLKQWPELASIEWPDGEAPPERVFDLSEILNEEHADEEVHTDFTTVGRHLPFPLFAVVGTGHGVFIIAGDEDGMYAYCYSAPVQMLIVRFTPNGWETEGIERREGEPPVFIHGDDERVKSFAHAAAMLLTLVERACNDTRHVVSYRLNRAERRSVAKSDGESLDNTLVHHICLNAAARERMAAQRGATVVPTPKRLHEVRAHWRHLASGAVVRVRSHTRGQRGGTLQPRVYTAKRSEDASRESPGSCG